MTSPNANRLGELSLAKVKKILLDLGVYKILVKPLSANDNAKNQIYFGSGFSLLNVIPTTSIGVFPSSSRKTIAEGAPKNIFRAEVSYSWVSPEGDLYRAPDAKLVYYAGHQEVRFSGFLAGSKYEISDWMDAAKKGRSLGRYLLLGVSKSDHVYGVLAVPGSPLASELEGLDGEKTGVFYRLDLVSSDSQSLEETRMVPSLASLDQADCSNSQKFLSHNTHKESLISELSAIHKKGCIISKKLKNDLVAPCKAPNCGGLTLEAELGISQNGFSEPDFMGWEVKSYSSNVITLMTPEPDGGDYKLLEVEEFIRKYGYPDRNGVPDRINFGGVHKFGERQKLTGLRMVLMGFDEESGRLTDAGGELSLITGNDKIALSWSFSKLLDHWKKKHSQAVYVPSKKLENEVGQRCYSYGSVVTLGEGTDFTKFLNAIVDRAVYYDPGIKLEKASSTSPRSKKRSQMRVTYGRLKSLYRSISKVDLTEPHRWAFR